MDVGTIGSVVLGAVLAMATGMAAEMIKDWRGSKFAAFLIYFELLHNVDKLTGLNDFETLRRPTWEAQAPNLVRWNSQLTYRVFEAYRSCDDFSATSSALKTGNDISLRNLKLQNAQEQMNLAIDEIRHYVGEARSDV